MKSVFAIVIFSVIFIDNIDEIYSRKKFVSNLSPTCLRCLCEASTACNMSVDCQRGYCGPFFLNKDTWLEGGRPTLQDDDPDRQYAFNDCVKDYNCSATIVENYMAKYGYDCTNDGLTDCDDYARILFHGKDKCPNTLSTSNFGRRYELCRPVASVLQW